MGCGHTGTDLPAWSGLVWSSLVWWCVWVGRGGVVPLLRWAHGSGCLEEPRNVRRLKNASSSNLAATPLHMNVCRFFTLNAHAISQKNLRTVGISSAEGNTASSVRALRDARPCAAPHPPWALEAELAHAMGDRLLSGFELDKDRPTDGHQQVHHNPDTQQCIRRGES